MALTNYILLIAVVVILPSVENAPSNIVKIDPTEQELRTRLVFIDRDADGTVNVESQISEDAVPPTSEIARSRNFAKSVQTQSNPPLKVKTAEPSALSTMDDERQIWGIAVENKKIIEDESYYNRPISLPKKVIKPSKPVRHQVVSEVLNVTDAPKPSACDTSIVLCCEYPSKVKECFKSQGCINATDDMFPYLCSNDSINKVIKEFGKYYNGNREV